MRKRALISNTQALEDTFCNLTVGMHEFKKLCFEGTYMCQNPRDNFIYKLNEQQHRDMIIKTCRATLFASPWFIIEQVTKTVDWRQ